MGQVLQCVALHALQQRSMVSRARFGAEPGSWLAQQRMVDAMQIARGAARLDTRPLLVQSQVLPALLLLQARLVIHAELLLHV